MQVFDNYIAGERVAPAEGKRFASINPTTGKVWGEFAESSRADVDRAVPSGRHAHHLGEPRGERPDRPARESVGRLGIDASETLIAGRVGQ